MTAAAVHEPAHENTVVCVLKLVFSLAGRVSLSLKVSTHASEGPLGKQNPIKPSTELALLIMLI